MWTGVIQSYLFKTVKFNCFHAYWAAGVYSKCWNPAACLIYISFLPPQVLRVCSARCSRQTVRGWSSWQNWASLRSSEEKQGAERELCWGGCSKQEHKHTHGHTHTQHQKHIEKRPSLQRIHRGTYTHGKMLETQYVQCSREAAKLCSVFSPSRETILDSFESVWQ